MSRCVVLLPLRSASAPTSSMCVTNSESDGLSVLAPPSSVCVSNSESDELSVLAPTSSVCVTNSTLAFSHSYGLLIIETKDRLHPASI